MKKRVYLTSLEYSEYEEKKRKDTIGNVNVRGNIVFYNAMPYNEFQKLEEAVNNSKLYLYSEDEALLEKIAADEGMITIPIEEYKQLLITKGKYEEATSRPLITQPVLGRDKPWLPTDITCSDLPKSNVQLLNIEDDKNLDAFYKNITGVDDTKEE